MASLLGFPAGLRQQEGNVLPVRHPNRDFFVCDLVDYSFKVDQTTIEIPIFSLATKPDLSIFTWQSKDKSRSVTVTPSVLGRANVFDKDLVIYLLSQVVCGLELGREDAVNRRVNFVLHDYLVTTNRPTCGREYLRTEQTLEKLRGTSIKTNLDICGQSRRKDGFGLIESWKIIQRSTSNARMVAVEVVLSDWLYSAANSREVLTINPAYFRLRRPLERRLYELARKHAGDQFKPFKIGLEILLKKCGCHSIDNAISEVWTNESRLRELAKLRDFRRNIRETITRDSLPDYRMQLERSGSSVIFYSRDTVAVAKGFMRGVPL